MRWMFFVLLVACTGPRQGVAQRVVRTDTLHVYRDTLQIDAPQPFRLQPFIHPQSFELLAGGERLDTTYYRLDAQQGLLWLHRIPPAPRVVARYETWPLGLQPVYRHRGTVRVDVADTAGVLAVIEDTPRDAPPPDPFGNSNLQRSGSVTRGVLAGSNRDVNIESGLRLQLEGEVLEGVNLRAVLTDENTPILAEGTTQRLSEFDRVYIEVTGRQAEARLGDVDLVLTGSELAALTRKVQGATASVRLPETGGRWRGAQVQVAGAAPRGQYRVQEIQPLEGVQGPYRLEGSFGEPYILVVPGSEIVYLNGILLVRDRAADYTIDYATGEITFTPRRLLTSDQRLTVEFQYTTNQYPRTLVATHGEAALGRTAAGTPRAVVGATFIREADGQSLRVDLALSPEDSLLLATSGDAAAVRTGAERVIFDPEAPFVQYAVERWEADSIFVAIDQAPADTVPVYRVRFSRMPAGTGRYARGQRSINGIAYVFVGEGGEYEPVRPLPKPREQQLLGLQGRFQPFGKVEVYGEWARSLNDLNRLSSLDAGDDEGGAYIVGARLGATHIAHVGALEAAYIRRLRTASFVSFDRTRPVDFARLWNLTDAFGSAASSPVLAVREATDEALARLALSPSSLISATVGRLERSTTFTSRRAEMQVDIVEARGPHFRYAGHVAQSRDGAAAVEGTWLRQRGMVEQPLLSGRLRPRLEIEQERRQQRYRTFSDADSLGRGSLAFVDVRPGIGWSAEKLDAGVSYGLRREREVAGGALEPSAVARTLAGSFQYRPGTTFQTSGTVGLRRKSFTERFQAVEGRQNLQTVALQFDARYTPLRRAVDLNVGYEAQTQRTPRLQEIYVRLSPELAEAQYVWQDSNGNGVPELDEFVLETTPYEGQYARTYVPSDTLVGVINVQARLRLGLDPSRLWAQPAGAWQRWLQNVSTRTTVDIQEKSTDEDLARIYLLDLRRYLDPVTTQNGRIRVGQEVFLFRGATRYGLDLSGSTLRGRNRLAGETESRRLETYRAEGRYRPVQALGLRVVLEREQNAATSARYASRRYDIESTSAELGGTWMPQPVVSLGLSALVAQKDDRVGGRQATVARVPVDVRLSRANRLVVTGRAELSVVRVEGDVQGQAAYELTDGRGAGTSYLWNVSMQYVLSRFLNLSLFYDGRAPALAPAIHTLRMQVSATF